MPPRISSYMTRNVVTVTPEETLAHARRLMVKNRVGRLVVVEEDKPVGMLTVSDMINALTGRLASKPLDSIRVKEVMSQDLKVIEMLKSIKSAALYMLKYKIGGLPVVDKFGSLVGIITRSDLLRAYYERYRGVFRVGDVMRRDVAVGRPEHHIYYIARLAQADPAGKVVIVGSDGKPVGIIAKKDLMLSGIALREPGARLGRRRGRVKGRLAYHTGFPDLTPCPLLTAGDVMTSSPETASPEEDLAEASRLMYEERIGALPVVGKNGALLGIVSKLEVLAAILKA
ncbi:CBS domain-containing protein [Stetteria hydrogenophila]